MILRKNKDSQEDIASRMKVHQSVISKLESGKNEPKLGKFLNYCKACGVKNLDVNFLLIEMVRFNK